MKLALLSYALLSGLCYWASVHTHRSMLDVTPRDVQTTVKDSVQVRDGAVTFKPVQ